MSETPRTDGFTDEHWKVAGRTFARTLERELATLRAELKKCKRERKRADVV